MSDAPQVAPAGLGTGGQVLWAGIAGLHTLDPLQLVQLEEACRAKDRLDKLDALLRCDIDSWATLAHRTRTEDYELVIDQALSQANSTANLMKQLLAAMRLPDQAGQRPQVRAARGAYKTSGPKTSAKDRLRAV